MQGNDLRINRSGLDEPSALKSPKKLDQVMDGLSTIEKNNSDIVSRLAGISDRLMPIPSVTDNTALKDPNGGGIIGDLQTRIDFILRQQSSLFGLLSHLDSIV